MKTTKFSELVCKNKVEPSVIFDLGSYDGKQSLELAEEWKSSRVFAFEADPELSRQCANNTNQEPRISVHHFAVGNQNGHAVFFKADGENRECGSLLIPNGKYFQPMPVSEVKVPAITLTSAIDEAIVPIPDIIWMDVQGKELDVLTGLGKYLDCLKMFWAEVAYQPYYYGQMLSNEFELEVNKLGFEKIFECDGIPGWFGDHCYKRMGL